MVLKRRWFWLLLSGFFLFLMDVGVPFVRGCKRMVLRGAAWYWGWGRI
jgi:hypothetical protein